MTLKFVSDTPDRGSAPTGTAVISFGVVFMGKILSFVKIADYPLGMVLSFLRRPIRHFRGGAANTSTAVGTASQEFHLPFQSGTRWGLFRHPGHCDTVCHKLFSDQAFLARTFRAGFGKTGGSL